MKDLIEENHLYVHVPFCRKRCRYCDFYSTVGVNLFEEYKEAIFKEIDLVFKNEHFSTIYFGGGTPSILPLNVLEQIVKKIYTTSKISEDAEITLEANPDDVTEGRVQAWKNMGINRISLGVQSFIDRELRWLGRTHTVKQNFLSLEIVMKYFQNVSIDLILHLPISTLNEIEFNIECIKQFDISHVSVYGLTVEKGTSLARALKNKEFTLIDEEMQRKELIYVHSVLTSMGFERYEVSNFAKNGMFSKHNLAYWLGHPYIGLGPSAHSYRYPIRRANVSHLLRYIRNLRTNQPWYEEDVLTSDKHWIEMLMLRLRTKEGLKKKEVIDTFGMNQWDRLIYIIETKKLGDYFYVLDDRISFTDEGVLVMDSLLLEFVF